MKSSIAIPATSDPLVEHPVRRMQILWIGYILLPSALVAWFLTKKLLAVFAAMLTVPLLAFLQGFFGMLSYRCFYGDSPLPLSPSHGVVLVHPEDRRDHNRIPLHQRSTAESRSFTPARTEKNSNIAKSQVSGLGSERSSTATVSLLLQQAAEEPPLRLLVLGDSLAVGVGQASSCTPVLPEVIAKTLSKRLGGRVVYWTCHGAPGASTGWIVRELERGVNYLNNRPNGTAVRDSVVEEEGETTESFPGRVEVHSSCSESEDSSSDESSESHSIRGAVQGDASLSKTSLALWKDRLAQQRLLFDTQVLGPYDIAVAVTGSNDLKSTFFPFLLKEEDAETWKQSQDRGGYSQELLRLLEQLGGRMHLRFQDLKDSVESATDTMLEKVGETLDRIAPGTGFHVQNSYRESSRTRKLSDESSSSAITEDLKPKNNFAKHPAHFPLVVLPGMPARALPAFQHYPLQWLSVPMVDIMDVHKRNLAVSHPGDVLFVPAFAVSELDKYVEQRGSIWEEACQEETVLAIRDVHRHKCRQMEKIMHKYYERRDPLGQGACRNRPVGSLSRILRGPPPSHWKAFSLDKTHPNERGYDFWGRHIGNAIFDEWQRTHNNLHRGSSRKKLE